MITPNTRKIKYVCGDLFSLIPNNRKVLVCHVVNNKGQFASGFAAACNKHQPKVGKEYDKLIDGKFKPQLSDVQFVTINSDLIFANMFAQDNIRGPLNGIRLRYHSLVDCMRNFRLRGLMTEGYEVHTVKFGSGIAGGNWSFIEQLIYELWIPYGEVTIYEL